MICRKGSFRFLLHVILVSLAKHLSDWTPCLNSYSGSLPDPAGTSIHTLHTQQIFQDGPKYKYDGLGSGHSGLVPHS